METNKLPHIASESWKDVWHDSQVTKAYQRMEGRHRATAANNQTRTKGAVGTTAHNVARPLDNGPETSVTRPVVWRIPKVPQGILKLNSKSSC
ncbi:hypothetical protein PoB_004082500 [Plakobranchus ocellatus]|uniref:Uncharacterized protein n=1 Tax=Plakobranchus ocellatus TaxID=259542 RepID=A0AAV4B159_9GAST|nr:hypothetical protein PoB_004082500 [Plakobranchus ocellatus]